MLDLDQARFLRWGAPPLFIFLWATGFIVLRIGLYDSDPLTLLAARYGCVELVLLPALALVRPRLPRGVEWLHLAVVGLLVQALHFGSLNLSVGLGLAPSATSLIAGLQPILVGLVAPWLAGERVSTRRWLGLTLGLAGAAAVIVSRASIGALPVWGLISAVGGLVSITGGTLYERRFGIRQHWIVASLVQCGVGLLVSLPLAAMFEPMRFHLTPRLGFGLAYLVFCNSILALTLLLAMLRAGEASRVSALFFLVPPVTALEAWLVLGQGLAPLGWAGLALSAVGVSVVTMERTRPSDPVAAVPWRGKDDVNRVGAGR